MPPFITYPHLTKSTKLHMTLMFASSQNNCFYIRLSLIPTEVFHLYFLVKPLI